MYLVVVTFHEFVSNNGRLVDNRFPRFFDRGESIFQIHEDHLDGFLKASADDKKVKACTKYRYEP